MGSASAMVRSVWLVAARMGSRKTQLPAGFDVVRIGETVTVRFHSILVVAVERVPAQWIVEPAGGDAP